MLMHLTTTAVGVGHRRGQRKGCGPGWTAGFIERVEDPAVLSQHRGIGQGDATGMRPSSPSVAVRRASREMMHEGAVRVMAEEASGRPQRRKAEEGRLNEYTGLSLTGRKLSEETSTRTPCKSGEARANTPHAQHRGPSEGQPGKR